MSRQNIEYMTLLHAGHGVHHGDWNFPSVYSSFARLYLCDGGEAFTRIGKTVYRLKPGYMYLMPPYTMYSDLNSDYFSHYYIHVYERLEVGELSIYEMKNLPVEVKASDFDMECIRRIVEINSTRMLPTPLSDPKVYDNQETLVNILKNSKDIPAPLIAETNGLLLFIIAQFFKSATDRKRIEDERIGEVINYIRTNLNKKLAVSDLAKHCFLSEDHFGRLFKKEMSCLPNDYVQRKKIEAAQIMLAGDDNRSIKDIAYSLAFENLSYFNRVFKKITGLTPSQYRKS